MNTETTLAKVTSAKISVVCPVYNSTEWVERTLHTVLGQTLSPQELIIVDDGSTDQTPELISQFLTEKNPPFRWVVLTGEHRGPGAARNSGIRRAQGDWIAFLDSDDLWAPDKLTHVAKVVAQNPTVNFICHHEEFIRLNGRCQPLKYAAIYDPKKPLPAQLYRRNLFSTSAVVCKKSLLLESGLFDEALMSAQDYDLWLTLSPHLRLMFIERSLGSYVERRGNISTTKWFLRLINECKIAVKYRNFVSRKILFFKLIRIIISYGRRLLSLS